MRLPKRRKPEKLGVREEPQIRNASHLQWVRGHDCSCAAIAHTRACCEGRIEAAHVRTGTDGGMAVKPSDCWVVPLCNFHHGLQHRIGEPEFERRHSIDMKKIAAALWAKSPHRHKSEKPQ